MIVTYLPIDGELVSREWLAVLTDCRRDGVAFHVNEGHRTWARQAELYALYRAGRGALAAKPSPWAPHIRTGRIDHAIDFGNASGVLAWMHSHGLPSAWLAVRGESWHVEVKASELAAYYVKHHGPNLKVLRRGQSGPTVIRLKKLLYARGMRGFGSRYNPFFNGATYRAVKRFQQAHRLTPDGIVGPATWRALAH